MMTFLLAAQLVTTALCPTVKPGPTWVCVNGGWIPPSHPTAPVPPARIPFPQAPLMPEFQIGKAYRRDATGAELFMLAIGVGRGGIALMAAECLNESVQDGCYFPGQGRLLVANASTSGWTEIP